MELAHIMMGARMVLGIKKRAERSGDAR